MVRFLDRAPLTPRQRAQRKYRASPKGRAATARARAKRRLDPKYVAETRARADAWKKANRIHVRVYSRIYLRGYRRRQREARA